MIRLEMDLFIGLDAVGMEVNKIIHKINIMNKNLFILRELNFIGSLTILKSEIGTTDLNDPKLI